MIFLGAEYKKGEKVILHGLKSHAKYNEQLGTITGKYIKKKGRWPVKLPDGKVIRIFLHVVVMKFSEPF